MRCTVCRWQRCRQEHVSAFRLKELILHDGRNQLWEGTEKHRQPPECGAEGAYDNTEAWREGGGPGSRAVVRPKG